MEALQSSDLWLEGVKFTRLLDWTAVGSILVFLTLLQAIGLANTSNRRLEAQQAVVLKYIRGQLLHLNVLEKITIGALKTGVEVHKISDENLISDVERAFLRIDPMSLPTVASMEAVDQSKNSITTLKGLYDPGCEDRELLVALLPFIESHTAYSIKILEREIEDRFPVLIARSYKKFRRGAPPSYPETYLAASMRASAEAEGN